MSAVLDAEREAVAAALPGYDVGDELGRGAWGIVLAGRHLGLERDVAIKRLPPVLAQDPEVQSRFRHEARLLASLDHPHIVPIYDFVERDGLCLLVMERLRNGTVWDRFSKAGLTAEQSCAIVIAASAGLEHAHRKDVLHRDVKPENMMFSGDGVLKVADFGIARVVGAATGTATRAGSAMGTPAYMAPEQARSERLTPATDVYAMGCVLFELLSGELPYEEASSAIVLLYQAVHEPPRSLIKLAPHVPEPVADVAMSALRKDPAERPAGAEQFAVDLAAAAASAWGPHWTEALEIPLPGAGHILSAGEKSSSPPEDASQKPTRTTIKPSHPQRWRSSGAGALVPAQPAPVAIRPSRRRPSWLWIGVASALVAAIAAVAIVLLVGNGSDESPPAAVSPATPKEVAQQWVEAINAGKIKEAASLFAIPSETNAPSGEPITIDTLGEAFQVMDALGCGGEIVDLTAFDEVVTVTRRLESRPGSVCDRRM